MTWAKSIDKEKDLEKRMRALHIFEKDIKERFVRSSGPGGQNVNKVSTCVFLEHIPTGLTVKCQEHRSQNQNRFFARLLLVKKIEEIQQAIRLEKSFQKFKKRRQKATRPLSVKEKVLETKRYQSQKKVFRRKIPVERMEDV